ncbi:hypothetical protein L1F30_09325 [Simiduia sp. 21SJ11W-1]|uniref:hypothetical protein n=1 Tax=Simiduia sp. 21SJ11W-1 TaxID=2909669 RepID=UPI0020A2273A|nr:hypothetical protein [Simiduia sp. 21SJ11W-1]UTA46375.1 hypothetical protein L1F30_09325 [Simiduia sp. 21SJ11W-1]
MSRSVLLYQLAVGVLVVLAGGLYYQLQAQQKDIAHLTQQVVALQAQVETLESQTLEAQVKRANSEILEGWQQLLKSFEQGVKESKKKLEEKGLLPADPEKTPEPPELERT